MYSKPKMLNLSYPTDNNNNKRNPHRNFAFCVYPKPGPLTIIVYMFDGKWFPLNKCIVRFVRHNIYFAPNKELYFLPSSHNTLMTAEARVFIQQSLADVCGWITRCMFSQNIINVRVDFPIVCSFGTNTHPQGASLLYIPFIKSDQNFVIGMDNIRQRRWSGVGAGRERRTNGVKSKNDISGACCWPCIRHRRRSIVEFSRNDTFFSALVNKGYNMSLSYNSEPRGKKPRLLLSLSPIPLCVVRIKVFLNFSFPNFFLPRPRSQ